MAISQPTVALFLRVRPQVKRAFEAEARRAKVGKAQMFERIMQERQEASNAKPTAPGATPAS